MIKLEFLHIEWQSGKGESNENYTNHCIFVNVIHSFLVCAVFVVVIVIVVFQGTTISVDTLGNVEIVKYEIIS